jgi:predicted lipoprotein with Yx(FWY)xxD motif
MRNRWWLIPGLAAAAVTLAACGGIGSPTGSSTSNPNAAANAALASVAVKTMSTSQGTVLVNSAGLTLYWFAMDTPTQSNCNGSCASYWKPVLGTATAAAGTALPHGFGTIKRSNGQTQVTYDGHPLYTYTGDTISGQVNGNGLNASGGMWWAITPSGTELGSASSSSSGSGSGGSSGSGSGGSSGNGSGSGSGGSSGGSGGGW